EVAADPGPPVRGDELRVAEAHELRVAAHAGRVRDGMFPVHRRGDEERVRDEEDLRGDGGGDECREPGKLAPLIRRFAPPSPRKRGEGAHATRALAPRSGERVAEGRVRG